MMDLFLDGININQITGNIFYFLISLIIFDILTGLLASARERKLNSSINFVGIIRKVGELIALAFATFLDAYFQVNGKIIRLVSGMLVVYESMSIIENFSRIGVNLDFLTKFFDQNKVKGRE